MKINLVRLLLNLSHSLDFAGTGITHHHKRVALMSLQLGKSAGLGKNALFELFKASILHDAGAVTWREKLDLASFDIMDTYDHCLRGYKLFSNGFLDSIACIVLSHHDRWKGGNQTGKSRTDIPLASRIIHLVDRIDVLLRSDHNILDQRREILTRLRELAGEVFDPDLVSLFEKLSNKESFWLELQSPWIDEHLIPLIPYRSIAVETGDLLKIAELFARIIDAKSPFTYGHSLRVARTARILGQKTGLLQEDCALLEVAGLLHDLGKVTVPEELLEKPGALTETEFNIIKQHPYYTYWWLKTAAPQSPLAEWAAFHHERPDGNGYPFRKTGRELDLPSQLVRAADIFTALSEERPYRHRLKWEEVEGILNLQVKERLMERKVATALLSSKTELAPFFESASPG